MSVKGRLKVAVAGSALTFALSTFGVSPVQADDQQPPGIEVDILSRSGDHGGDRSSKGVRAVQWVRDSPLHRLHHYLCFLRLLPALRRRLLRDGPVGGRQVRSRWCLHRLRTRQAGLRLQPGCREDGQVRLGLLGEGQREVEDSPLRPRHERLVPARGVVGLAPGGRSVTGAETVGALQRPRPGHRGMPSPDLILASK